MSLLLNVLFAWKCSSTHHKLALDALQLLEGDHAAGWRDCFLAYSDAYLKGAKAPDDEFKDFKNHVLHVRENNWGGAPQAATTWYAKTVAALRTLQWREAAYAAGVLSHYYSDPIMPLHTAQSEKEGAVHRPLEWSVTKSYDDLRELLPSQGGFPVVVVPTGEDWLGHMVRQGAAYARPYYEMLIDRYDLARGVKDPPAGLDQLSREVLCRLLGYAASGIAGILERAFAEAGVAPPRVNLTLKTVLATLSIPLAFITKKLKDRKERALLESMYREFQATGQVVENLPEDDRTIRQLHAAEVVGACQPEPLSLPLQRIEPDQAALPTPRLRPDMPVEEAPSVGPKTAARLAVLGVQTVADLQALDATDAAKRLAVKHITATTITEWQDQAELMCEVPGLRVLDVQLIVACGVRTRAALAASRVEVLYPAVEQFLATPQGERVLRSSKKPERGEVAAWITAAQEVGARAA